MPVILFAALGAGVGSAVGGGAAAAILTGLQIGAAVGTVVQTLTGPPADSQAGRIQDLRVSGSAYGAFIPQTWGAARLGGNCVFMTPLVEHESTSYPGGKKSSTVVETYKYSTSVAFEVCMSKSTLQLDGLWLDSNYAYSRTGDAQDSQAPLSLPSNYRFCPGGPTATPDSYLQTWANANNSGRTPAYRDVAMMVFEDWDLSPYGNRVPNVELEISETVTVYLSDVLTQLLEQVGLSAGTDFDVSAGSSTVVTGFTLTSQTDCRTSINAMLSCFPFDLMEADGRLRLVAQGGAVKLTVDAADLGAMEVQPGGRHDPSTIMLEHKRGQDYSLPARLDFSYQNPLNHFQTKVASAYRVGPHTQTLTSISVDAVFAAADAANNAERLLDKAWFERDVYTFTLPPKYLVLAPCDCILLPTGPGALTRVRILTMQFGVPSEIHFTACADDPAVLSQSSTAAPSPSPPPGVIGVVDTVFEAWSGIELRDQDTTAPGFYVAAAGGPGWGGCEIYYSLPDPVSGDPTEWIAAGTVSNRTSFGVTTSALASGTTALAFDHTSTVDATLSGGNPLTSTTETLVPIGQNIFRIGNEILGAASAMIQTDGSYILSDLYRGMRASVMTDHAVGDSLVAVTPALARVSVDPSLVGTQVFVRCVSGLQAIDDSGVQQTEITIAAPHPAYATPGDIAGALASVKAIPFWRTREYLGGVSHSLDATYFKDGTGSPGANYPSGITQSYFTRWCAGPGGGWDWSTPAWV